MLPDVSLSVTGPKEPVQPSSAIKLDIVAANTGEQDAEALQVEVFFDEASMQALDAGGGIVEKGRVRWESVKVAGGGKWMRTLVMQTAKIYNLDSLVTVRVTGEDLYATQHARYFLQTVSPPAFSVRARPNQGTKLTALDGRITLDIPAGAVTEPATISLHWTRPRPNDPNWLTERFDLAAINDRGEPVSKFAKALRLTLHRDIAPQGVMMDERALGEPLGAPAFFWWDPAAEMWRRQAGRYDVETKMLTMDILHFSTYGSGDPSNFGELGLPQLKVDASSLFAGEFSYRYPLASLAGPHGFGPRLALVYSDEAANSAWDGDRMHNSNDDNVYRVQASTVGYGWQVGGLGKVSVSWNSSHSAPKKAFLSFAGGSYELIWDGQSWRTQPESFLKIWRDYGGGGSDNGDLKDVRNWHVLDQNGVEYVFGNGMGAGTAYMRRDSESNCGPAAYAYYVTRVEDASGNHWEASYTTEQTDWTGGDPGNCDDEAQSNRNVIRATYPNSVRLYRQGSTTPIGEIQFIKAAGTRHDTDIKGRHQGKQALWADHVISEIRVKSRTATGYPEIFRYTLAYHYSHGTTANCDYNNSRLCTHSLLDSITVTPKHNPGGGAGGSRTTTFSYWTHSGANFGWVDINFSAIYLQKIHNGHGGELFLYREAHDHFQSGYETKISNHYRQRLLATRTTDGLGHYVWQTFTYSGGAYDLNDASNNNSNMADDEFAGFSTVDARLHDATSSSSETPPAHDNGDISQTIYSYKQGLGGDVDEALRGRLWRTDAHAVPDGSVYQREVRGYTAEERVAGQTGWARLTKVVIHADKGGAGWDKRCTTYDYDVSLQGGQQYGRVTHVEDRPDWCSSAPYRTTITQYAIKDETNAQGVPTHYQVQPAQKKVKDGGNVCRSLTQYFYYAGDAINGSQEAAYGDPGNKGLLRRARAAIDEDGDCGAVSSWAESEYDYYADGNAKRSTQPPNHAGVRAWTETTWDSVHGAYAVTVTNNLSQSSSATYDLALGVVKTATDANGVTNEFEYDGYGRLRKSWIAPQDKNATSNTPTEKIDYYEGTTANNTACSNSWCMHTMKLDEAGGDNYQHGYTFMDGLGRTLQTQAESEGGQHIVTDVWYHETGQVEKQSTPYFVNGYAGTYLNPAAQPATQYQYDGLGRTTIVTATDGTETRTYYQGYKTAVIDALNHLTMQESDDWGRLDHVWQYMGVYPSGPPTEPNSSAWDTTGSYATATYDYDVLDRLTGVTGPAGSTEHTTIAYDLAGRKKSMDDPDMGGWSYTYDAVGNLRTQTDARNCKTTFSYDALNRLTGKSYSGDSEAPDECKTMAAVSYTYDQGTYGKGRRTGMSVTGGSSTAWVYDKRGRMTSESKTIDNTTYTTSYSYDAADRMQTMTYPNPGSETVTYHYNAQGLLENMTSSVRNDLQYVKSTVYDASSRVTQRVMQHKSTTSWTTNYSYYPWNQVNGQGRLQALTTSGIQNLTYTYDAVGNIKSIVDGENSGQRQCFNYDAMNRLTQAFTGNSTCTAYQATGDGAYDKQFQYAANGNLTLNKLVHPNWDYRSYTYDNNAKPHAVVQAGNDSFGYDANGNMLIRTLGATYTLSYDAENRLVSVSGGGSSASFVYDGDGNRVKATIDGVTTYYVGRHYEYRNSSTYTKYFFAGNELVAFERSSGYGSYTGRRYVFRDHLGSTSVIVNGQGNMLWKDLYYPFGDLRHHWDSTPGYPQTAYRYTGQRLDAGVAGDLYDYIARRYDPALGRFIQPDTIVPNPGDPQSLNRYSYVGNNPLRYVDPSGHKFVEGDNDANYPCGKPGQAACVDSLETAVHDAMYPEAYGPLEGYPVGTTEQDIYEASLPGIIVPDEGTRTIGACGTAGLVIYGQVCFGVTIDSHGDYYFHWSPEGGGMLVITASVTGYYATSNADDGQMLLGPYMDVGGSAGEIVVVGYEHTTLYDKSQIDMNKYSAGFGFDISSGGPIPALPLEAHFGGGDTLPIGGQRNIFDELNVTPPVPVR